jgi:hypothetical protein
MHIDGWNIGPGNDNKISCINLRPTEYLAGNKTGILIALDSSLYHYCGTRAFSFDEMYPQRILGILKKNILPVFRLTRK